MAWSYGSKLSGGGTIGVIGGEGIAGRVTLWDGVNTLGSDAGLTFTGTGDTFTLFSGGARFRIGGVAKVIVDNGSSVAGISISNDYGIAWTTSATAGTATDLGLARASAGVLKVTSGGSNLGSLQAGNLIATALATPTITSVTPAGTDNSVTYGYKVVALLGDLTTTAASAETTNTHGATAWAGGSTMTVLWPAVPNAATYKVYRTTGAAATGEAAPRLIYTGPLLTFVDTGLAGSAETPATANTTGQINLGTSSIRQSASFLSLYGAGTTAPVHIDASGNIYASGAQVALGPAFDAILYRAAAATLQLGAANSATPIGQRIQSQGGSGSNIAGADFVLNSGPGTGAGTTTAAGRHADLRFQTPSENATAATAQVLGDRHVLVAYKKTLTLGSATTFCAIDFPASSTISVAIGYNVTVTDSAAPPEFKANGGRYYFSAYRKSTGNGVAGAVVETGDSTAQSVGSALTDAFTVTGTATGVTVAQNVTVGTGLTAPNVGTMTYEVIVHGSGPATVTPTP